MNAPKLNNFIQCSDTSVKFLSIRLRPKKDYFVHRIPIRASDDLPLKFRTISEWILYWSICPKFILSELTFSAFRHYSCNEKVPNRLK